MFSNSFDQVVQSLLVRRKCLRYNSGTQWQYDGSMQECV